MSTTSSRNSSTSSNNHPVINDFNIHVATINGSGSQTANMVLLRAIFQMGIPVSGKNLFPSNIQGLPTWFTIRVNKDGYIARREKNDILVAMNPETAREDVMQLDAGAMVIYDEPLNLNKLRDDLHFYPVPFDKLVRPVCPEAKLRKLVRNMIYDGVLACLLGIDIAEIENALKKQFKRKSKAIQLNFDAAKAGFEYAGQNFPPQELFRVARMNATQGKIIIDGNSAAAMGSMFAGVTIFTWYPITPSSTLGESLAEYMKRYRIDPVTQKATFAIVQAEDELAAIGMAIGAGWAGARAMTATSGPGISLMAEFVGLAYYAEVPVVIFNVQRVGPSTGLPTRTMQGDILFTAVLSHGDTKHLMLLPCSVEECFTMAGTAFDLAEEFQTPVFVMLDLDLGMNYWMSDPFQYPNTPFKRGKVLSAEDLERVRQFARYKDVDGDGIPYRTLPGTPHPLAPYFTRGSGHNEYARYSERPEDYKNNMDRLARKFETARQQVPAPEIDENPQADVGIIGYGTSHWAILESRDWLRNDHGLQTSYLRLKAYPFNDKVLDFVRKHRRVYVVDQNRDAQMLQLLKLELDADQIEKLRSVRHYDGLPITPNSIVRSIRDYEKDEPGVQPVQPLEKVLFA
ncbi:MAG: 2-oxoacid:acceptor oxidoreductase subunit alpha [candidate division KSB1 bacterium]|nr:2-oxoacid:acceptor oxidoreductase subunit alpha [candidate division KSB1 bacterium]MDZ7303305.1 2-oxoacid:acceptor oxidoreductase subunit alpha [candidate division KSB1 bacterium]MDZ7312607.1 2-oxoacid:acceptor oxidoreductase subunit alpha [candidate division KSB1 bacterium]